MPVVGYIFGGVDFSGYFIVLGDIPPGFKGSPTNYAALKAAGVAMFGWGEFLTVVINFLILAFIIFLIVRQAGKMFKTEEQAPAPEPEAIRSEEHTSELQSLMRISYAVFCFQKKN